MYSPNLSNDIVYCAMNNKFVDCKVDQPYTIRMEILPEEVKKDNSFTLRIYGIN